jgi:alpha-aminoadipic semialdehyde synthase
MLRGNKVVGVVREAYNKWERRAPLCPVHVQRLARDGIQVLVQPSDRRVFTNSEYEKAGATITEDLSPASVIFGVKQIPVEKLLPERTYVFFSHVIKAQPENMELLDAVLERNVRLIDYETITKGGRRDGPRLVAFGGFAGRAGMISAIRGLGERLLCLGYSTPFLNMGSAYMYPSLKSGKDAVAEIGSLISSHGLPEDFAPCVFAFTGNGNVSRGAQEVFEHGLPHEWVKVEDLPHLPKRTDIVYGCVVEEEGMVERIDKGKPFSRQEYYSNPELYQGRFHTDVVPYVSCLVNCTYWDHRYPRLLTKGQIKSLRGEGEGAGGDGNKKMIAVSDISCDIEGSVEFLTKSSYIEAPFFMYDPVEDATSGDLDGNGVLMCGVDILPSELPRESSMHFGDAMIDYVVPLATSDGSLPFSDQLRDIPPELHGACIAANGELTPSFSYIESMRKERERNLMKEKLEAMEETEGSAVFRLTGHLFDSGFINKTLDIIEADGGEFYLVEMDVRPNSEMEFKSSADIQITMPDGRNGVNDVLKKLNALALVDPTAEAMITEMPFEYCSGDYSKTLHGGALQTEKIFKDPPSMTFGTNPLDARKKVLILGAGLVSAPAVEYLSRKNLVTVVSGIEGEASGLVSKVGRNDVNAETVDVSQDSGRIMELVESSDVVLSLLPAPMHVPVAKMCIGSKTPLVTASYVSEEMQSLDEEAKNASIPILCEMGLDPGMDHMSAMKIIDEVQEDGGYIKSFSSLCGGLPAPEAANNPLRYKFSWSPRGVITAAQNNARYLQEGNVVEVDGQDLLRSAEVADVVPTLSLEQLPNRDSMPYGDIYGISSADTVYRGTLRYAGWSSIIYDFKNNGLLEMDQTLPEHARTWKDVMESLKISDATVDTKTHECLSWLGAMNEELSDDALSQPSIGDAFCSLLQDKLEFGSTERDMVLMRHDFEVTYDDGRAAERKSSLLLDYGDPNGDSSMARTVGLTIAIGAQLVLDGGVSSYGVLLPTTPDIYIPSLSMLKREGLDFLES